MCTAGFCVMIVHFLSIWPPRTGSDARLHVGPLGLDGAVLLVDKDLARLVRLRQLPGSSHGLVLRPMDTRDLAGPSVSTIPLLAGQVLLCPAPPSARPSASRV